MADFGDTAAGIGVNMGIGRGVTAIAGRLPVPLPSFYNGNSQHPFRDSQANRMLHGDTTAMRHYAGKVGGAAVGQAVIPIPYIGGMIGGWAGPHILDLFSGHGWNGNKVPSTSVGGQPATIDNSGRAVAGDISMDPFTGAVTEGSSGYMPRFSEGTTGSRYGPNAGNYSGYPSNPSHDFVMPDFSEYGGKPPATTIDVSKTPPSEGRNSGGFMGSNGGGNRGEWSMGRGANGETFISGGNGRWDPGQGAVKRRDPGH